MFPLYTVATYPQELWEPGELENCQKCAEEHDQLAKWLEELKECHESENDNIFYQIRKKLMPFDAGIEENEEGSRCQLNRFYSILRW